MNIKTTILYLLVLMMCGCGYTILKEEVLSESDLLADKLKMEEKKILYPLLPALKLFEQYKPGSSQFSDPIEIFRNKYGFQVDQRGRVYLHVFAEEKRKEIPDSLIAIGSIIEKEQILSFAMPLYTIWLSPNMIRRVASWSFVSSISAIEKPSPGYHRTN